MTGFRGFSFLVFFFFVSPWAAFSTVEPDNLLSVQEEMVRTAGYGEERLSSVLVTGTVLCEACLPGEVESRALHVPGALVGVACKTGGKRRKLNWSQGATDKYGDFIVDLPSRLHAIPRLDSACRVTIVRLPKRSPCRKVHIRKTRAIQLSSVGNGIRTYTTGVIKLRQQSKPGHVCIKKGRENAEERTW
ncbi:uncharacterized protein LOC131220426 [Magnolia sinica]|uniref:uncharacterized protein LOC131220426 n=1 Tax=Magnolia sinica TaxID=86752 RepID=UPI002659CDA9|nr:uncharacterized protein LOC131220426 [Magnolia sinica]